MRDLKTISVLGAALMALISSAAGQAQHSLPPNTSAVVPALVNFNGVLTGPGGKPLTEITGVTFFLYQSQQGGAPLWMETQNVQPDENGRYAVMLGSTTNAGLPSSLFSTGEARWLGVQAQGQAEQPRVPLASVPYAMKAVDAQTVGGLSPSAFLLAPSTNGEAAAAGASHPSTVSRSVGGGGTADYIPIWTDSSGDLGDSVMFQSGSGSTARIGINTAAPATTLDVQGGAIVRGALTLPATGTATASRGFDSQPLDLTASVYNTGTSSAVSEEFRWQAEPLNGVNLQSGTLNLLFGANGATPAETGVSIAGNGQITFATGQGFPGTGPGTITGVTAGTDLAGGGESGTVTLYLDTTKVPQLAGNNTYTGSQTVSGSVTATSFSGGGAGITGVNASQLGGLAPSAYAQLAAGNTFTGKQTINNSTVMTGNNASGVLQVTNVATSGRGPAIVGTTNSDGANAIKGIITATTGTDAGVYAVTSSAAGNGVYGVLSAPSVEGTTLTVGAAVRGDTNVDTGLYGSGAAGVLGTADAGVAGAFLNTNSTGVTAALVAANLTDTSGLIFEAYGGPDVNSCIVDTNGSLECTGSKSAVVAVDSGARKVALYAVEAPENWFEDVGSGQLSNGSAYIALDATFAQTVNTGLEYHVFLTPNGDCEGLYVGNRTARGFEVHELRGGHSHVAFDYRIMAKRSGYESVRLADVTEKYRKMGSQRQAIRKQVVQQRAQSQAKPLPIAASLR